jgi:hypothetical protein
MKEGRENKKFVEKKNIKFSIFSESLGEYDSAFKQDFLGHTLHKVQNTYWISNLTH